MTAIRRHHLTQKAHKMTLMVSIARVADVPNPEKMPEIQAAHEKLFAGICDVPKILRDPNDASQVALVMQVHNLDELRRISRTPEGDAMTRRLGFLEQLSYFLEE